MQAYKLGMYGADYVWILHEIVGEPWWHKTTHECNQKQLQEVSENLLIVSSHNSIVSNEISYSGLVSISAALRVYVGVCEQKKHSIYIFRSFCHLIIQLKSMPHFLFILSLNLSSNRFTINFISFFSR